MSSYGHVVHTTAKQVISRRRKNENVYEMSEMKTARAKRAKLLFLTIKDANVTSFLPSSSWLHKLPNSNSVTLVASYYVNGVLEISKNERR